MSKPKPKKCASCRNEFIPFSSTAKTCTYKCAMELLNLQKEKKKVAGWKREKKAYYEKDLSKQKALTRVVFNKLRRLEEFKWFKDRGLEPECISCGKTNMDWCCSHLKTVASRGDLRYDRMNTYLACNRYCNKGLSGNINGTKTTRGYLVGLAERFGQEEATKIIDYCDVVKTKKWTCEELIEMRKQFNKEIRELEKGY